MDDSTVELRKCKTCGEEKPLLSGFHKQSRKNKYFIHCKICIAAKDYARYHSDIEKGRARNKAVYARRQVKARKSAARYRIDNLERVRASQRNFARRWFREHPFEAKAHSKKQRALKRKVKIEPITKQQIDDLYLKQRGKCAICYKKLAKWHVDHVIPLSKGGEHGIKNFQLVHPRCNLSKSDKHPIDFMQKLGFLL